MSCEFCKGAVRIVAAAWHDDTRLNPDGKPKSINAKVCPDCGESLSDPTPLTLDELRARDGKPVYATGEWYLVCISEGNGILLMDKYGDYTDTDTYGLVWLAYDRAPHNV